MRIARLNQPAGLDNLVIGEKPTPQPGPGEILVRVHASSLNFHDFAVIAGFLPTPDGRIPMADGAGEVVAVGDGVTRFQPGDKVMSTFYPNWQDGAPTPESFVGVPGDQADGFAAEYVAMPASGLVHMPKGYSYAEAATLPCAALTAWRALMLEAQIKPGDWVLTQGTGGVSIFALQLAKAVGAHVISTSSSPEKLERLSALGADHVINYKETPEWGSKAKEITGGRGVDQVIEIGGPGTLAQSIAACTIGGHISLIGVLTGISGDVPTHGFTAGNITLRGFTVGSRRQLETMVKGIETLGIKPVISDRFALEDIAGAFAHQMAHKHFGKIVLEI
ncbi:MAG: NAD(P)-dependent alcohol dehydrogenase [Hyphomonadaceae bacterium]|nr:NAD(P)-dependent alcohol dehydrogenase [Hyphomonadaceae bacterium]